VSKPKENPVWLSSTAWFYKCVGGIEIHTESGEKIIVHRRDIPMPLLQAQLKPYLFHLSPCLISKGNAKAKCRCGLAELLNASSLPDHQARNGETNVKSS
jgi:hypothetical protein